MAPRHLSRSTALAIAFVAPLCATGQAQPPGLSALQPVGELLLQFDENGNAMIAVAGGPLTPLSGALMPDPACQNCGPALTYLLPEPVISGDVEIPDPPSQGGGVSDWLRFTDSSGDISGNPTGEGSRLIYYSLPDGDALADVPFPANIGLGNFLVGPTETLSDGTSSFDYQPGGVPYPQNNEFIGISDEEAVPEPPSWALLLSGLAAFGLISCLRSWR